MRDLPKRYILVFMSFLGLLWAFGVRTCITIALVKMVRPLNSSSVSNHTNNDHKSDTFDWSQETQGAILSSFFIGNTVTLLCGGYLAEKFGGKWTLSLGILLSAVSALLTPPLVGIGTSYWSALTNTN